LHYVGIDIRWHRC